MYKVKTPNENYNGVTEGVAFAKGIGYTENKNTLKVLINDYKYEDVTDYRPLEEAAKSLGEATARSVSEVAEATGKFETVENIDIEELTVPQLKEIAKDLSLTNYSKLTRDELIELIESNSEHNDA